MSLPKECPLCKGSNENINVLTKHVFGDKTNKRSFYKCEKCDVSFQYPFLTKEEESIFYKAEFEKFMTSRSGESGGWNGTQSHIDANKSTVKRRFKYLLPHIKSNSRILEIGCSSGFMLYPLVKSGHECVGIEPSGFFREFVSSKNIEVYDSIANISKKNKQEKFDLIMHFFVLEHITNPIEFLNEQLNLLKPGGKIIFEIPNVADALYSVYDIPAFERFYWSIAHPWYFSESSLNYLLNKIKQPYELLLDQRYDLSNHIIWARDGKPGGMNFFTKKISQKLEEEYKKHLIKNKICDTLIGVITKK